MHEALPDKNEIPEEKIIPQNVGLCEGLKLSEKEKLKQC